MSAKDSPVDCLYFILFLPYGTDEASRLKSYRKYTRRSPDTIQSPEESKTPWWWYGYVTDKERQAADEDRQLKFDVLTRKVKATRRRAK